MTILLTDLLSRTAATIAGILLLIATTSSLLRTVVVPRSLRSYISELVSRGVISTTRGLARLRKSYVKRDGILAWAGPSILILQLITWLLLYLVAYGLLLYGFSGQTLGDSMRQAGSSLFTLGFADINTTDETLVDFLAAATGPIVIALMIGFLPTIYSSYLDRETAVTEVCVAVGDPAWGPEMLSRYALADRLDSTAQEFERWTQLAASMRMSHTMYPVLLWVRSSRPFRHYLVSLLAVLDAASLTVALTKTTDRRPAFQLLAQGGQTMEVLYAMLAGRHWNRRSTDREAGPLAAQSERSRVDERLPRWNRRIIAVEMASDEDALVGLSADVVSGLRGRTDRGISLPRSDFDDAVELLRRSGFPIECEGDEAWDRFRSARVRYEYAAYAICEILDAPRAPWSGTRRIETPIIGPHSAVALLPELMEPAVVDDYENTHGLATEHAEEIAEESATDPDDTQQA